MVERIMGWYRRQELPLRVVIGVAGVFAVILVICGLWYLLLVFVKPHTVAQKTSFVQMVVGIIGGLTLIGGLLVNFWGQNKNQRATLAQLELTRTAQNENQQATLKNLDLTRQGQITDRFTRAIDQLGKTDDEDPPNKVEEIRLGAIYALEQIAIDDPDKYHRPIMQVFVAYLRRYASWQGPPSKVIVPAADTQTVLNVLGRRSRSFGERQDGEREDEPLHLNGMDFSNYTFPARAHLERAWLSDAYLEGASLSVSQLKRADLRGAHLEAAFLNDADLSEADLRGAHFEGAYLWNADLKGADLRNAHLTATDLRGATISEDTKLDPESLEEANGDYFTEVGEVTRPKWWSYLPGHETTLEPGAYSVKVWKTLLHFSSLGEGWYSTLMLPYSLTFSPAGVSTAGRVISFTSGPFVSDPNRPKDSAFIEAPEPEDMVTWFENHPLLRCKMEPQEWENPSGGASGMQFYVEVNADTPEEDLFMSPEGPSVQVFPTSPRNYGYVLVKEKTNRVIVLEGEDEWMVLITEASNQTEFDKFKDRVDDEVLANLYWGKKAHELLEGG